MRLHPLHAGSSLLVLLASPIAAQFHYQVTPDLERRVWQVEGRFANPGGGDVDFWIARWTPGAYHVADYGRFAGPLVATTDGGHPLEVERHADSNWTIHAQGAERIVVRYPAEAISTSIFSNNVIDVESNRITKDYAYITPVSLFGFVPERMDEPFSLDVMAPEGWKVRSILGQDAMGVFHAPSYERFEDSPLFLSPTLETVETEAGGKPLLVTVHGQDDEETIDEIVDGCVRIVEAAAGLMQGLPYERYHFLLGYVPEGQGSGLEHSDSTLILTSPHVPLEAGWGIIAHEFFHLWCAERIHVEAIRDPDYTQPLQTSTIWVNESITEYFAELVLLHAGFREREQVLELWGVPHPHMAAMASQLGSSTKVSRAARDWGGMQDLMMFAAKMYMQGPRMIFALDMEMRRHTQGERGVLDLVRHLYASYAAKGRGFPEDGMLAILNEVAQADLSEFYAAYIDGAGNPDSAAALEVIGYEVDGEGVRESPAPSPTQLAAREDYFSIDG